MKVEQVYSLVNGITSEIIGETGVLQEDFSNVVDVGNEIFNNEQFDHFCNKLVDRIGLTIFVSRAYAGGAPNILKTGFEFGAAIQKIKTRIPEAVVNEDWQLQSGNSYDPFVFNAPDVIESFYSKRCTFELDRSITEEQVKSAFLSQGALSSFVSMLETEIGNSMTIKTDGLIMGTIDTAIALAYTLNSNAKIDVLKMYNDTYGLTGSDRLTTANMLEDADFLAYASKIIGLFVGRFALASKLFNVGGEVRFTPKDKLHCIVLDEFEKACDVKLASNTFHKELVSLPMHETVSYWQGSGTDYALSSTGKISIKVEDPRTPGSTISAELPCVLATLMDDSAAMVACQKQTVSSQYNAKGNFTNYFYKQFMGNLVDTDENCVVFVAEDAQ